MNWLGAGSQVTGDAALLAFACPGSAAAQLKACKSATDAGACAARGARAPWVPSSSSSARGPQPDSLHGAPTACLLGAARACAWRCAGPKGMCNQLPGCVYVPLVKECLPKALDGRSLAEYAALAKAYSGGDAATWGGCPGACYVRQVRPGGVARRAGSAEPRAPR